jgi:hypothetical protein
MVVVSSRSAARCGGGALLRDVDIHGAAVADVVVAPDGGHQLLARMHLVGMLYEMGQQPELQVGEVEFGSVSPGIDSDDTASRFRPLHRR